MNRIGVSLDFYGTLVEIDQDAPTLAEALTARGYPCSAEVERIWNSAGFDGQATHDPTTAAYIDWRRDCLTRLACLCGAPESEARALADEMVELDQTWTVRARPFAQALMAELEEHEVAIVLLTNWDYPMAPYLRMSGLRDDLAVISSAEIGVRKPHVAAFEAARARLSVTPARHIHVGDDWGGDVTGAIRSGAHAVWLQETGAAPVTLPARILPASPDDIVGKVRDLIHVIGNAS